MLRALQRVDVKNDGHVVFCEFDVQFHPFCAALRRRANAFQRIFRRVSTRAAMAYNFGQSK